MACICMHLYNFQFYFMSYKRYNIAVSEPAEITSIAEFSPETGQLQHLYDRGERKWLL